MKKKTKTLILSIVITLVLLLTFTLTYAVFTYQQTGGNNQQLVLGDIYMHYNEINALSIENAMPGDEYSKYFEFTISGKNTYTKQDIYYDVVLSKGDVPEDKTEENRISDEYLKFKLVEVIDGVENEIFVDRAYNDLTNKRIHVEIISKDTIEEIKKNYRLYMTISDTLVIGNTEDSIMTSEEYKDAFASIKVSVTGDFLEKDIYSTLVDTVKGTYGKSSGVIAVNTEGNLYDSSDASQEIREYRYSGVEVNNYVIFNDDGDDVVGEANELWRIIGVFKDIVKDSDGNVVLDSEGNPTYEEKVKLLRDSYLTADEFPATYLMGDANYYLEYSSTASHIYWNSNSVNNNNDWTTAGLQYYLNTEVDETDTSDGTLANVGYLKSFTSTAKSLMSKTTYHISSIYEGISAKVSYNQERDKDGILDGNQATWDGLVGLMYPSDYGYSTSSQYWDVSMDYTQFDEVQEDGGIPCYTTWMKELQKGEFVYYEWFISPTFYDEYGVMLWNYNDFIGAYYADWNHVGTVARPTIYITSSAKVHLDGDGSSENPYIIIE